MSAPPSTNGLSLTERDPTGGSSSTRGHGTCPEIPDDSGSTQTDPPPSSTSAGVPLSEVALDDSSPTLFTDLIEQTVKNASMAGFYQRTRKIHRDAFMGICFGILGELAAGMIDDIKQLQYPAWPGPVWTMLNYVGCEKEEDFRKDASVLDVLARLATDRNNADLFRKTLPHIFRMICDEEARMTALGDAQ